VSVEYLLQRYASRWSIEVTFYDMKQFLGFADSQAWSRIAVERTAPFVAYLYTIIVIWYAVIRPSCSPPINQTHRASGANATPGAPTIWSN
jgi:hypothetical protein